MYHRYIIPLLWLRPTGLPKLVYKRNQEHGNKEWDNYSTYAIVWICKSHNQLVQRNGNFSPDLAHRETPPALVGGKTHADTIYTRRKSNQKRTEWNEETKYNEMSKLLLCPPSDHHPQTLYLHCSGWSGYSWRNSSTRCQEISWCSAGSQLVHMWL